MWPSPRHICAYFVHTIALAQSWATEVAPLRTTKLSQQIFAFKLKGKIELGLLMVPSACGASRRAATKGKGTNHIATVPVDARNCGYLKLTPMVISKWKSPGVKDGFECIAGKFNRDIVIDTTDCIAEIRSYCDAGYTDDLDGVVRFGDATSECIRQALFKPTAACHQATLKKHLDCDPTYVAYPNNTQTTLP